MARPTCTMEAMGVRCGLSEDHGSHRCTIPDLPRVEYAPLDDPDATLQMLADFGAYTQVPPVSRTTPAMRRKALRIRTEELFRLRNYCDMEREELEWERKREKGKMLFWF